MGINVAVATDHRGFQFKAKVLGLVAELGHHPIDFGPETSDICDYPEYGSKVAQAVSRGEADRGVLICGTGIGMCIIANKFPRVRAANCTDDISIRICRRHNDANILCLSGDLIGERIMMQMIETFLNTDFEGGRHARRLENIADHESRVFRPEA